MAKREILKGNIAAAEAAVRAGVDFFAGYPITPSTEALEHLSYRMLEEGRAFVQAENEIAAISMVTGAVATGKRALTLSSGPGISLKQEGFSYLAAYSLPFVCMNVQRWGTGLGSLESGQSDYLRETRGGGNGDYRHIVYAPGTVQELVDMMYGAFDIAEKYRNGVMILSEAFLGQMMAPCAMPEYKKRETPLNWGLDGTGKIGLKRVTAFKDRAGDLRSRLNRIRAEVQDYETLEVEDADYVFVAFGLPGRVCLDAVRQLRSEGQKVGVIRPKIVWPYPIDAFKEVNKNVKGFIVIESNDLGQMAEDVRLSVFQVFDKKIPVHSYPHSLGVPSIKLVKQKYKEVLNGTFKEVF